MSIVVSCKVILLPNLRDVHINAHHVCARNAMFAAKARQRDIWFTQFTCTPTNAI